MDREVFHALSSSRCHDTGQSLTADTSYELLKCWKFPSQGPHPSAFLPGISPWRLQGWVRELRDAGVTLTPGIRILDS